MAGAAGRAIAGGAAGRAIAGGGAAARGIAAGGAAGRAGAAAGPGLPCPGWADAPTLPAMEPIPRNPTPRNNATKPMPRASMTALPRHTVAQPIQRASTGIVSAGSMAALLPATIEPATNWPDGQISSVLRNRVKSLSERYSALQNCWIGCTARLSPRLQEGTKRDRHVALVRIAMDACCVSAVRAVRTKTRQRTAKSCGPGAATLASIPAGLCQRGNGDNKGRSPGRVRISRKPLRGESRDVLAVPVV